VQQRREQLPMQLVHVVVVPFEAKRSFGVLGGDHRAGLGDDALGDLAHLKDVCCQCGRHGAPGIPQPGHLGDVTSEVSHALKVRAHPHGCDDDPQISGHRLLTGEEINGKDVQPGADEVKLLVGLDDALGQLHVGVEQGCGGPGYRRSGEMGHLDELIGDRLQVLVEGVTHTEKSLGQAKAAWRSRPESGTST
jgi:hypothetical protein